VRAAREQGAGPQSVLEAAASPPQKLNEERDDRLPQQEAFRGEHFGSWEAEKTRIIAQAPMKLSSLLMRTN